MTHLSDRLILDFLAGKLMPLDARVVEDALRRNVVLRERAERLEQAMAGPAPGKTTTASPPWSDIVARGVGSRQVNWTTGLLAVAIFALGFGVHAALGRHSSFAATHVAATAAGSHLVVNDGTVAAAGVLRVALESSFDGRGSASVTHGVRAVPIATYLDERRRPCREYDIIERNVRKFAGVACRGDGGNWHVSVHVAVPAGKTGYVVASAGEADVVSAVSERLRVGPSLDHGQLETLIAAKWRQHP